MQKNIFVILPILFIIFSAPSFTSHDVKAITLNSTSTGVTPNPATTTIGKAIAFHAKVVDSGLSAKTIPTGTVTWDDGGKGGLFNSTSCTLVGLSTSASSTCSISYTPSTSAPVTITGTYGGDSAHTTSFGTASLTVNLRTTTTTITPNPGTTTIGKPIAFSAKINDPGLGTKTIPTGTVTWNDGGKGGLFNSTSCSLKTFSIGESICYISYTPSSSDPVTITGTYGGDSAHTTSFGTASLTVNLRTTTTTVTPNPATTNIGKPIAFTAKVNDPGLGTTTLPTGTVSWDDGGKGGLFNSTSCILTTFSTSTGICAVSYTPSTSDPVTITGTYGGDSAHATSFGATQLTMTLRTTTTTVTPNPGTTTIGKPITFSAKVNDPSLGTKIIPTGTVTWDDGGKGGLFNSTSCTLTASSTSAGTCYVTYTRSTTGSVTITGSYGGDSSHATSFGTTPLTVTLRTTTTTVTPNPGTTTIGKAIIFTAKVNDPGLGTKIIPTGTVTWNDGGKGGLFNSTSCTLTSYSTSASKCAVSYTPSTSSPVTITGSYGGDSTHATSSSTASLTVTLRPTTTALTGPATAHPGDHKTIHVTVTDTGSGTKTTPTGSVTWNDGGKGGSFGVNPSCTLVAISNTASSCSITYTAPSTPASVTITGTYGGDSTHLGSNGPLGILVS